MTVSEVPGDDLPEIDSLMEEGDISSLPELDTMPEDSDLGALPELEAIPDDIEADGLPELDVAADEVSADGLLADELPELEAMPSQEADVTGDLTDLGDAARLDLGETVTSEQAEALAENILQHRNSDLVIDAAQVNRIDTTCIEVLLSAAKLWVADRSHLSLANLSEEFSQALSMLGLNQSMLESGDC